MGGVTESEWHPIIFRALNAAVLRGSMTYAFKPNRLTRRACAHPEWDDAVDEAALECHRAAENAFAGEPEALAKYHAQREKLLRDGVETPSTRPAEATAYIVELSDAICIALAASCAPGPWWWRQAT